MTVGKPGGTPGLFLPGAGWTGMEGAFLKAIRPDITWHVLDLPGSGGTDPIARADLPSISNWLFGVADALGISTFHLAGHSLGGFLALGAASSQPERVRSLFLIDGGVAAFPRLMTDDMGPKGVLIPLVVGLETLTGGRLFAQRIGRPAASAFKGTSADSLLERFGESGREFVEEACADLPEEGEAWDRDSFAPFRLGFVAYRMKPLTYLQKIQIPTLAVSAKWPQGKPALQRRAQRAVAALRQLDHVSILETQTGHYPFWEDAPAFLAGVRPFYDRLLGPSV